MIANAKLALLLAAALLQAAVAGAQPAGAPRHTVPPELFDRPRSAELVLRQPAIRAAVAAHLAQPGSRLVLRHGSGQNATLQAEELRAWLVALAVDPERVLLAGDRKPGEAMIIEVQPGK